MATLPEPLAPPEPCTLHGLTFHARVPLEHLGGSPRSTSAGPRASLYPAQLCPAPAPGRATRSSAQSPARPGSELERQPEPSGLPRTRSQAGAKHSPRLGDQRLRSDSRAFLLTRGNRGSKGGDGGERNTGGPPPQNGNRESEPRVPSILPRG